MTSHPFADPTNDNKMTKEQWLAVRKEAALHVDPETAEVDWTYGQIPDPYGVDPDLPEECQCVGRNYFARSPGSDVWVWFGDLPEATRDRLWARIDAGEFTDDLTWLFDEPVPVSPANLLTISPGCSMSRCRYE